MKRTTSIYDIAIVGAGPTGLSALENLFLELENHNIRQIPKVLLFDNAIFHGSGQVYDLDQPSTNWLNIPQRNISVKGRKPINPLEISIPAFPSYLQWSNNQGESDLLDLYPSRAWLGKYLNERYLSMANVLQKKGILAAINQCVVKIENTGSTFGLTLKDGTIFHAYEVVLTIGHQSTRLSGQLTNWQKYCEQKPDLQLFTEPYPVDRFSLKNISFKGKNVALRGFGLAMLDVTRALSEGLGGRFELVNKYTRSMKFTTTKLVPSKIIPFSKDGLSMVPKPLNQIVDQQFKPRDQEMKRLRHDLLVNLARSEYHTNHQFLVKAIAKVAAGIFINLRHPFRDQSLSMDDAASLAVQWLNDEATVHTAIVPLDLPTDESMKLYVSMATGNSPVSLDYCIGQVWRHCQPLLYRNLSFTNLSIEIVKSIIDLDERIKRYSYGPPVASIQQLLALINANIVSLKMVDDPDIMLSHDGWNFEIDGTGLTASTMINTVLDPPRLLSVKSELIQNLLTDDFMVPIHQDLGVHTYANGLVVSPNEKDPKPLSILGRLANGSVVGIDSLKECFGQRTKDWAEGVVKRLFIPEPSTSVRV